MTPRSKAVFPEPPMSSRRAFSWAEFRGMRGNLRVLGGVFSVEWGGTAFRAARPAGMRRFTVVGSGAR